MKKIFLFPVILLFFSHCHSQSHQVVLPTPDTTLVLGAARLDLYLTLLEDQNVALVVNQTSLIGTTHLLDTLLSLGVNVKKIFAPEHGFRGDKDAGETVDSSIDKRTGVSVVSLYGQNKKPTQEAMEGIDLVIFDIQDVGARFYTYISTLHYIMEACAEANTPLMVLDRPNPNGHYVAGPILEEAQKSFVGMHPIPIMHGMTIGEYAGMINGEGWLANDAECELVVVPMANWDHLTPYSLPIKPSPNLPNDQSILLYPSICLFEGTVVSVGRGTTSQFQVIGHPEYPDESFRFTPISREGAKTPPLQDMVCYGKDLTSATVDGFTLFYLIHFYKELSKKNVKFFNSYFPKLAGNSTLQKQIESGMSEQEILATWEASLELFKEKRKKYLLYDDFE